MPFTTRTFRVFVSSTFEDLRQERNALHREVFPKLRKLCESHGARFQAIDLRWGVREEAALDHKTMDICLGEIERCQRTGTKPNFIILLGDRYGWRPVPARIEAKEFDAVCAKIEDGGELAYVRSWYQLDQNADPFEYVLNPRTGAFVNDVRWRHEEAELGRILCRAARIAGLRTEALMRYVASATHQEILKGLGATREDRKHVFAFFRSGSDAKEYPDLSKLKEDLRRELGDGNIFEFPAGDAVQLCSNVAAVLEQVIAAQVSDLDMTAAFDFEIKAHEAFAADRSRHFTGRETVLAAVTGYVLGGDRMPLVLHGASGSGKSAIMAKAGELLAGAQADSVAVRRFIGATPDSLNGQALLSGLFEEIAAKYGVPAKAPSDFNLLVNAFKDKLALGTAERPLWLFIDAIDQLGAQDRARELRWLPAELPAHCKLIVSTVEVPDVLTEARAIEVGYLPHAEAEEALSAWLCDARRRLQPEQREKLLAFFDCCPLPLYLKFAFEEARLWKSYDPLASCLLGDGLTGIIDVLFDRLSKQSYHGSVMVGRSLSYLASARYGLTEDEILSILTSDDQVWDDFENSKRHDLSGRQLPVIVWSRLSFDLEPYLAERAAPGGTVTTFYHRQLAERVAARFAAGNERLLRHAKIAEHFAGQSNWLDSNKSVPNPRRLTEMVRQYATAGMLDEAQAMLTDIEFLTAKCCAGLVIDTIEDFRETIAALPEAQPDFQEDARRRAEAARWTKEIIEYSRQWISGSSRPPLPDVIHSVRPWPDEKIEADSRRILEHPARLDLLRAFASFVEQETYPLIEFGARPGFTVQQAFNHAPHGPVHEAAEQVLAAVQVPILTRVWSPKDIYNPKPALLKVMEGHHAPIASVDVTPDGRHAISGGHDNVVRLWDLENGTCLRAMEGHTDEVCSVSLTPDARRAISSSKYGVPKQMHKEPAPRVWDLERGKCLRLLEGHTDWVESVDITPDGRRAVSGSQDKTVRVWDLENGACLHVLEGHTDWITSVCVTPDARLAVSASADTTVRVWDLEAGTCRRVLQGHTSWIECVSITPDGTRAVSGCQDKTVRVWDLETGECLKVLEGNTGLPHSVRVTSDGRLAVSAFGDSVRIWDVCTGECLRMLTGDLKEAMKLVVTPDGCRAISGSYDRTVRLWNLETGTPLVSSDKHDLWVKSVTMAPDGRTAVSASWDTSVRVWDTATATCARALEATIMEDAESAGVTPDVRLAVYGSYENNVEVWDLEKRVRLNDMSGHEGVIWSVCVTPDGRRAASASYDRTARIWNVEAGSCVAVLIGHSDSVWHVNMTPDGQRAITASGDKTVRLWDAETGTCLRVLEGHTESVVRAIVMQDGKRAISSSRDRTVRVWDLETGACLRVLEGHLSAIIGLAATPDGRLAISTDGTNTARVWDVERGTCLAVARLQYDTSAVAVSMGFDCLIVGAVSGEVLMYKLRGPTMAAERAASPGLDEEQVRRILKAFGIEAVQIGQAESKLLEIAAQRAAAVDEKTASAPSTQVREAGVPELELLRVEIGYGLLLLLSGTNGERLFAQINGLRRRLAHELGFFIPAVRITDNLQLAANEYRISFKEGETVSGRLFPGDCLVMDPKGLPIDLTGIATTDPAFGLPAVWVAASLCNEASGRGYTVVDPETVLTTHLAEVLKSHMAELLSYGETKKLLNGLPADQKALVDDLIPSQISVAGMQRVLQKLLAEQVSIRDLSAILEAVAEALERHMEPFWVSEHVRERLARQLCHANLSPGGYLPILVLSSASETLFEAAIAGQGEDRHLALTPQQLQQFITSVRDRFDEATVRDERPVLLTSPQVRPLVRDIVKRFRPQTTVMSQKEIHESVRIRTLAQV